MISMIFRYGNKVEDAKYLQKNVNLHFMKDIDNVY